MKKSLLLTFPALIVCTFLCAQTPKFGKVSAEELQMTSYDKDPDAAAVILYEDTYLWYQISDQVQSVWDYRTRIKILKPEGTTCADVSIPYISSHNGDETISSLEAVAYNLENGKIIKTPLKKQYIFREQVSDKHKVIKFSIPEVKTGTVIEYRYRKTSDYITHIPPFRFQHDIPVIYSYSEAAIPEFFRFNIDMKGYLRVNLQETSSTGSFPLSNRNTETYTYNVRRLYCEIKDIPALKKEPFIWCLNDFRSMLEFELSQIAMPYSTLKNYTTSWESVNDALSKTDFNSHSKIGNPFKAEVAEIVNRKGSPDQTAHDVLKLVQSKMKWNEEYRLFSDGPRIAANKGTGTSADINFVLMAALKDAGFRVIPILLNPRHAGRLPYTRATINSINAFILMVELGDGRTVYADGTDPNSDLNLLPTELLVDRARIYGVNGTAGWCDLTTIAKGVQSANMILEIGDDNTVRGKIIEDHTGQSAFSLSKQYDKHKTEEEFIAWQEKENGIRMEDVELEGIGTPHIRQSYQMEMLPNSTGEFIYLNATIIPFMSSNKLNAQTRLLPVEFAFPVTYNIRCSMLIPEDYTVEALPKSIAMSACDNGVTCRYVVQQSGQYLQFNFLFSMKRIIFPASEFPDLNTFYGMVADLSKSQIVLKKN